MIRNTAPSRHARRLSITTLEDRTVPAAGAFAANIDPALAKVVQAAQATTGGLKPGDPLTQPFQIQGSAIWVELRGHGDYSDWLAQLQHLGFQAAATSPDVGVADGYLPISAVTTAAALPDTTSVIPVYFDHATNSQGSVANGAEISLRTALASRLFGVDGTGLTIGVISDSADSVGNGIADSQASGDLPAGTQVQDLNNGPGGSDEGRAMMELIYDIAPKAKLRFYSGSGGDAAMAAAIKCLVAAHCNIIVDDLNGLTTEPYFQDGKAAQALTAAVNAGVTYLSSQGNRGTSGYEAPFHGVNTTIAGISGRWNNFDTTGGTDTFQQVSVNPGQTTFVFQFDDPYYGGTSVTHTADLYMFDSTGTTFILNGGADNTATKVPRQIFTVNNPNGFSVTVDLAVRAVAGGDIGRFKYIAFNDLAVLNHLTDTGAIVAAADPTHGGAAANIPVAAADTATPTTPEWFTGVGPVTRLFGPLGNRLAKEEIRNSPELTSNDGDNTSVPGFAPFYGTSAAAPNAAGVALLAKQFKLYLTPALMRAALDAGTVDINTPGYDLLTGHGLLDATGVLIGLNGGVLPINGDFDSANENDQITLRLKAGDSTQLEIVVNGNTLGDVRRQFIKSVAVNGKGGNNTLTLDFTNGNFSFPNGITFDGGGTTGANTLAEVGALASYSVTGINGGTLTAGGGTVKFTHVGTLVGGGGNDTFTFAGGTLAGSILGGGGTDTVVGDNFPRTFTVAGSNSGSIGALLPNGFAGISNLTGGFSSDTFKFNNGGSLAGNVDGGLGANTWAGDDGGRTFTITAANAGTVGTLLGGTFSRIQNLTGGGGDDSFVFNGGTLSGAIDGALGTNTLTADGGGRTFTLNLAPNSGTLGTLLTGRFSHIQNLTGGTGGDTFQFGVLGSLTGNITGGAGTDTLIADYLGRTFTLTGANAGTLGTLLGGTFAGVENLTGGVGKDTLVVQPGGSLAGMFAGGLGYDTADLSALGAQSPTVTAGVTFYGLTLAGVPTVAGGLTGIDRLIGSSATTDVLTGENGNSLWTPVGANAGHYRDAGFRTLDYTGVENLTGGTGNDTFSFTADDSLTGAVDGGLGTDTADLSALTAQAIAVGGPGQTDGYTVTGVSIVAGNLKNMNAVVGSLLGTTDSLTGLGTAGTYTVTGVNTGTYQDNASTQKLAFRQVENLTGGSGNDTLVVKYGGLLSGAFDGAGGTDTADLSALPAVQSITVQAPGGTDGFNTTGGTGVTGGLKNINKVYAGAAAFADKLTGLAGANATWLVKAGVDQSSYTDNVSGRTLIFANFEAITGSSGIDGMTVDFSAGNPLAATGLTADGGGGTSDTLTVVGQAAAVNNFALDPGALRLNGTPVYYKNLESLTATGGNLADTFSSPYAVLPAAVGLVTFNAGGGDDTATITPTTGAAFNLDGGTGTNNTLKVLRTGQVYVLQPNLPSGTYTFTNRKSIVYTNWQNRTI